MAPMNIHDLAPPRSCPSTSVAKSSAAAPIAKAIPEPGALPFHCHSAVAAITPMPIHMNDSWRRARSARSLNTEAYPKAAAAATNAQMTWSPSNRAADSTR